MFTNEAVEELACLPWKGACINSWACFWQCPSPVYFKCDEVVQKPLMTECVKLMWVSHADA